MVVIGDQETKSWDNRNSDLQVVFDVKGVLGKRKVDARL
jgi:hypothetical protein